MAVRLCELAALVSGAVIGDGDFPVTGAATLTEAMPGQITFLDKVEKAVWLEGTAASAAVVPLGFVPAGDLPVIQVKDVQACFGQIMARFQPPRIRPRVGISPQASVSPQARLAADVDVYPFASIEENVEIGPGATIHSGARILAGCRIGAGVTIHPNAVLYEGTIVGDRAVIHAGVVLGADGFGYRMIDGKHKLGPQFGHVEIGADVDIGANTTIDRGAYGTTLIGEGTKIDDQVMIGHNCRVGRHNLICSQVGIAGSTTTGDYVVMAGRVGVADHIHIGKGAVLGAMSGVSKDVPDGARMFGAPAIPEREQKVQWAALSKLPEMRRQLKKLWMAAEQNNGTTVAEDETP
jgi:UDP-3-O-[3-hydroxymyristoyl] glucosamine N-acyltransferase